MFKKIIGLNFIIFTLCFIALILWLLSPTFIPRFSSFPITLSNIGQLLGLFGIILMSFNFFLSTRLKILDKYFFGLNNIYSKHNYFGQIAFILILFHPLLLIPKYSTEFTSLLQFLWFNDNWAKNFGILAFVVFLILIILTLYVRPSYQIWKNTHKFFGIVLLLSIMHILLIQSDLSRFLPLKIYILFISFIGLISYIYYTIFGFYFTKKHKYEISHISTLNEITNLSLKPINQKINFVPGQFVFVNFLNSPIKTESHPFSITSSPTQKKLELSIKNLGDFTNQIKNLSIKTIVEIEGPFGKFNHTNTTHKSQIWIAGGIGITPFISMAKSLKNDPSYKITLYYCTKNEQEAIHLKTLSKISQHLGKNIFKIIPFYSDKNGRISINNIIKSTQDIYQKDILICAPPKMIFDLKKQLSALSFNSNQIYSEEFIL